MKNGKKTSFFFAVFLLLLFRAATLPAQNCDSIIRVYSFDSATAKLDSLLSDWGNKTIGELRSKYKIGRFGCGNGQCEGIRTSAEFRVDSTGHVQLIQLIDDIQCGHPFKPAFKADFLKAFDQLILPEPYRNKCYRYQFGAILKC